MTEPMDELRQTSADLQPASLSPAAQATWDAYNAAFDEVGVFTNYDDLAIALRALADQLHMKKPLGETDADAGVHAAHHAIHAQILAIATELEALK